ncbi:A24 family peptidase [Streptomyces phaeochromogenes]|uniref:prepilin peptidase n=1 Tax=Streptomyces phaeochromogenes TaxID=1923 RepID=UPI0033EA7CD7
MDLVLILGAALWGAAAGLLIPRAAYRFSVAPDEPWQTRCPEGHLIGGWVGAARCRECGGRGYGPSTPLVVLATALVCGLLAAATGTRPELGVWLLVAPLGVLLAVVDFSVQRLPDVLTLSLAGAALVLLVGAAAAPENDGDWLTALYGSLALGGGYFVLFLINPNGMGFGDVKLALGLGAVLGWYGWGALMLGTFAGFLFGGLYGLSLVVVRRAGRKTSMPFGPFLIAGAFVGLLIGAYAA